MNWLQLWHDFLNGHPDAVQAIFAILGFIITTIGTFYVVYTFRQQKQINKEQQELNRLSVEKDRREIFPFFSGQPNLHVENQQPGEFFYDLILKENKALEVDIFPINKLGKYESPLYSTTQVVIPDKKFITIKITDSTEAREEGIVFKYLLYFTDQVGRPYIQNIGYDFDNVKTVVLYPQVVKLDFRQTLRVI